MTTLPGYHLREKIYQGTRTVVYRGTRLADNRSVVIKFLHNEYPTFADLLLFRNQYTVAKNLNLPGIVQPLAQESYGNGYGLVMPDEGYIALGEWQQGEFAIVDVLTIAVQLADILHGLHQNRVIHKDLKPANILIHPKTKHVKLIDFSIASLLPKETQEIQNPNVLEGTLAYISPEQTGRMNRGIDYRTDFYSVGITLYELLTGELPFQSDDPMELVHCHIAKSPMRMGNGERGTGNGKWIPPVLAEVVMRLMAKNAEDRYQSALGLKYDLEKCLVQWKDTGKIEPFALGERDICDRFIIPEKLYGRESEVETLLAAFARVASPEVEGKTEMMLVAGYSGIGKTAVVNEVHKPIVRNRGYFIKGKFDQFNRNVPFSAFVQAFRDLMGQLLSENDQRLHAWQTQIREALGENGQVIVDVIPELEQIIGKQSRAPALSGTAAQNRFNLLFQKFIRVFTTAEHPLVIFLDDLQWADSASLSLMELLMAESETVYLLFIGAYRDNEVFPAHPLMSTLDKVVGAGTTTNTITLQPLSSASLNRLVAETLNCDETLAQPLTQLVAQKTGGNPFFATQFLKALHQDGLIRFDVRVGHWHCDLVRVREAALTNDVVEFMALQLQKLPAATQEILQLAACIGNQFDLATLAIILEKSEAEAADRLWKALQEGFILPQSEVYKFYLSDDDRDVNEERVSANLDRVGYRFLHDRVQQAAYFTILEAQKQRTHLRIGQLLFDGLSPQERSERIFDLVNQLNLGRAEIANDEEKQKLARLNLQAGKKAKLSAAYKAALNYCTIGIRLLSPTSWETDYEITYKLYRYSSEAAYLSGDFEGAEALYAQAVDRARTPLDKAVIYRVQMTQYQLQGRNREAIEIQRKSLKLLGDEIPREPEDIRASLDAEIATVKRFLEQQTVESILKLKKMTDDRIAEMLRILQILFYAAFLDGQLNLGLLAVAKMTTLSLQNGNSDMSPFGYVGYGTIANALLKEYSTGHCFGEMAVRLCEQFDNADVRGMTNFLFAADVHSWSRPIRQADKYYENAYKYGMDAGNWLTVSFMAIQSGSDRLTYGKNLDELYAIAKTHADFLRHIQSFDNLDGLMAGVIQPIRNLLGLTKTSRTFDDDGFSEAQYLQKHQNNPFLLSWLYSVKIRNAYLFENTAAYPNLIEKLSTIETTVASHTKVPSSVFYVALMHLSLLEMTSEDSERQIHWQALAGLEERLNRWEAACPENIRHKCQLIQAEKFCRLGRKADAIELYDLAIAGAKENGYIYEEALANELAAKFYLRWGKEKIAACHMLEAYYCYARWGAKAKTDRLARQYPDLLASILQQHSSPLNSHTTHTLTTSTQGTSTLDLTSVIKASQAISGEIELEALLSKLMSVVLENAGADKGALILNHSGLWKIAVECQKDSCSISTVLLDDARTLPTTIVNTVARTQKTLLLNDVSQDSTFAGDRYFIEWQPKSLFCTPILKQGQLIGILYLENHHTPDAFTPDCIELLNLLMSQAAISLENAHLYNTLEQKVEQRTAQLLDTLEDLKATQKKLVESEKMAALGNLVAGVAHEINTPVGTSITVASTLADETQTFINAVRGGQLKRSVLNNYLELAEESTQLMLSNLHRAGDLIQSFKQIANDQSCLERRCFHLQKYVEEIALSLDPQLKQTPHTLTVEGDETLTIESYPGVLAQIVTNLVTNSLTHAYPSSEAGQLRFDIGREGDKVKIEYKDNGCGIEEENLGKIFEPFFTTARHRGGTGLGLHIVYNLVTQKLQGIIDVRSKINEGTLFIVTLPQFFDR